MQEFTDSMATFGLPEGASLPEWFSHPAAYNHIVSRGLTNLALGM